MGSAFSTKKGSTIFKNTRPLVNVVVGILKGTLVMDRLGVNMSKGATRKPKENHSFWRS